MLYSTLASMRVVKDVFFANVTGSHKDNHHLDLFLPAEQCRPRPTNDGRGNGAVNTQDLHSVNTSDSSLNCNSKYSALANGCTGLHGETVTDVEHCEVDNSRRDRSEDSGTDVKAGSPLVIFVHGGGWRRGGREAWTHYLYFDVNFLVVLLTTLVGTYKNVGQALARSGIACAVISYPLTEVGLFCLLTELLLSYIQSCLAVLLVSCPVLVTVLFEVGLPWFGSYNWLAHGHNSKLTLLKTCLLYVMMTTNIITTALLAFRRKEYKLRTYHIRAMWILLTIGAVVISQYTEHKLPLCVILTLVVNQLIILRLRLSRCGGCYEDQTQVLAKAVRWAKTVGQDTGLFDTSRVYLMGHSAGGHLATLTVLDDNILANVGCTSKDIKVTPIPLVSF